MVKCSECGFLGWRNPSSRQFIEVDANDRTNWMAPTGWTQREYPLCFMQKRDIGQNYEEAKSARGLDRLDSVDRAIILRKVLDQEFSCTEFREWQQGFSPKEHREMADREKMLEWQENRVREDRKWRWIQAATFAILGAAVAIIAALIGRG